MLQQKSLHYFLKIFVKEVKTDTGLFLDVLFFLPFLNKCLVIAYFKPLEKIL